MAYVTITLSDGTQREVSNLDDIPFNEAHLFSSEVERLIRENKTAGKAPFDGIDWPKGSGRTDLTGSSLFQEALKEQILATNVYNKEHVFQKDALDKMEATLDFVNRIMTDDKSGNIALMQPIYEGVERGLYSSAFMGYVPLETQVWLQEYIYKTGRRDNVIDPIGHKMLDEHSKWQVKEDTLSAQAAEALARCSSRVQHAPVFNRAMMHSDWSKVSDEAKEQILDWLSEKKNQERAALIDKMPAQNLSQKAFFEKKNMTLQDVEAFFAKEHLTNATYTSYRFLRKAPEIIQRRQQCAASWPFNTLTKY